MAQAETNRNQPVFTRGRILRGIAAVGGGLVIGGVLAPTGIADRIWPRAPEPENILPIFLFDVPMVIKKGAHIRTSPHIPPYSKLHSPRNDIHWEDIDEVNGTPLNNKNAFLITNVPMVEGSSVSGPGHFKENYWVKVGIKLKGSRRYAPYYISDSSQTRDYVQLLSYGFGSFETASLEPNGITFAFKNGDTMHPREIGRTYAPLHEETIGKEFMPGIWAEKMKAKFEGSAQLRPPSTDRFGVYDPGERIFDKVMVVPAGMTWDEREVMEKSGAPVDILNYPAKEYLNGEPVSVVGKIPQGTIIKNVYHDGQGWGYSAFRLKDIQTPQPLSLQIPDPKLLSPDTIYAVSIDYLQKVS